MLFVSDVYLEILMEVSVYETTWNVNFHHIPRTITGNHHLLGMHARSHNDGI